MLKLKWIVNKCSACPTKITRAMIRIAMIQPGTAERKPLMATSFPDQGIGT